MFYFAKIVKKKTTLGVLLIWSLNLYFNFIFIKCSMATTYKNNVGILE